MDPNGLDLPMFTLVDGRLTIEAQTVSSRRALVH